jgi:hypothetical protein
MPFGVQIAGTWCECEWHTDTLRHHSDLMEQAAALLAERGLGERVEVIDGETGCRGRNQDLSGSRPAAQAPAHELVEARNRGQTGIRPR